MECNQVPKPLELFLLMDLFCQQASYLLRQKMSENIIPLDYLCRLWLCVKWKNNEKKMKQCFRKPFIHLCLLVPISPCTGKKCMYLIYGMKRFKYMLSKMVVMPYLEKSYVMALQNKSNTFCFCYRIWVQIKLIFQS